MENKVYTVLKGDFVKNTIGYVWYSNGKDLICVQRGRNEPTMEIYQPGHKLENFILNYDFTFTKCYFLKGISFKNRGKLKKMLNSPDNDTVLYAIELIKNITNNT